MRLDEVLESLVFEGDAAADCEIGDDVKDDMWPTAERHVNITSGRERETR